VLEFHKGELSTGSSKELERDLSRKQVEDWEELVLETVKGFLSVFFIVIEQN